MKETKWENMEILSDYELEVLIREVEENGLLEAPLRMKESILSESRRMNIQMAAKANKASVKVELWVYSLKTAVAVAVAIFLFGIMNQAALQAGMPQEYEAAKAQSMELGNRGEGFDRLTDYISDRMEALSDSMDNFTTGLIEGNEKGGEDRR